VRTTRLLLCLLLTVGAAVALSAPARGDTAPPAKHYYVALGDSLAQGYMPGGDTTAGYVDDLYASLRAKDPALVMVKLGCSGETTGTMINGGRCSQYTGTGWSQLTAAEAFVSAHQADVKYLTLDIGANDVDGCTPGGSIDPACLTTGVLSIGQHLNTILSGLRAAGGGLPQSVGMTYYDPFLQYWLTGYQGQLVATASIGLLAVINTVEALEYSAYGFGIADVAAAFQTTNFSGALSGPPVNVQTICDLTYMCSQQNIHPNVTGYQLIADTFAAKLT
jgi:lysophospholipase L1-like esterase